MSKGTTLKSTSKRKQPDSDDEEQQNLQAIGNLEMLSDEEDGGNASSDDGDVDEFPELVGESSDEDEEGDGEDEEDEEDEDEETDAESDSGSEIRVFPKAKTIVSEITNQPKLVYPDIEPDYDSDSSTEDVSDVTLLFDLPLTYAK